MAKFSVDNGLVDFDEVLPHIPSTAKRVKIQNASGQEKWRDPEERENGDKVIISNGEAGFMYSKPGRKSSKEREDEVTPQPTTVDAEESSLLRKRFMERDMISSRVCENPSGESVLDAVLDALAEEQASLAFERKTAESRNAPISQISLRRVNALKTMGELWFKRKEQLATKEIDLASDEFARLLQFVIATFIEAMEKSQVDQDSIAVVGQTLLSLIRDESWVSQARKKMRDPVA